MFSHSTKRLGQGLPGDAAGSSGLQKPHFLEYRSEGIAPAALAASPEPTVFHITHWKAGSQWVNRILHHCVYDRLVLPAGELQEQFLKWEIQAGKVYPTLYVTKEQFEKVDAPRSHRRFVIIRDLRDTLVSVYFSTKVSHKILGDKMASMRGMLQENDLDTGMLDLLHNWLPFCAAIQESWLTAGEPLTRYEDMLQDDLAIFERLLLRECELPVTLERLRAVVLANRFEVLTGGRQRGCEDVTAHERKGVSGDWRVYFTDRVKRAFKERFGKLLIATGYEKNLDW